MHNAIALTPGRLAHARSNAVAPAPAAPAASGTAAPTPDPHTAVRIGPPREAWAPAAEVVAVRSADISRVESASETDDETDGPPCLTDRRCAWIGLGTLLGGLVGGAAGVAAGFIAPREDDATAAGPAPLALAAAGGGAMLGGLAAWLASACFPEPEQPRG